MRKLFTFIFCFLMSFSTWAEVPQTISYQAVVRNNEGKLMREKQVGVRVSIIQDSTSGKTVYSETRTVSTNNNGLLTFAIGDDDAFTNDTLANVSWADHSFFLRCEMDPDGGSNYIINSISPVNSVPFALYAKQVSQESLPSWIKSEEKPVYNYTEINGVPIKVSELQNDVEYIAASDTSLISKVEAHFLYQPKGDYLTEHQSLAEYAKKTDLPKADSLISKTEASATYQTKGNYLTEHQSLADYAKRSELPKADSLISKTEASATYQTKGNYLTEHQSLADYAKRNELPKADSLISKTEASTIYQPKGNYLTEHQSLAEYAKRSELPKADSLLSQTEASATYQPKGNYLIEHQSLADYAKKSELPTIPSNVSEFNNDAEYVIKSKVPTVPTGVSAFVNDAGYITPDDIITGPVPTKVSAFKNDANYATMSDLPTKVSELENDAKYAKQTDIPTTVSQLTNDARYVAKADIPTNVSSFTNDANYVTTTDIPTIPANVSAFENDANYATKYDLPKADSLLSRTEASATYQKKGNYLTSHQSLETYAKISDMPVVPSNVSAFKNDVGYISINEIPTVEIPTKVSAFENDANYAKKSDLPKADSLLSRAEASATYQVKGDYLTSHQSLDAYVKKSELPAVPTKVSQLSNDSKYITAASIPTKVSAFENDANYAKVSDIPVVPSNVGSFKNDAGYITSKDVYNVIPANVSAFENDANYAKKSELPKADSLLSKTEASATYQKKGNYLTSHQSLDAYAKKSDVPTVPTNVSSFKNDAAYITAKDVPAVSIPSNISSYKNDAGYITAKDVPTPEYSKKISAYENDANYVKKSELPKADSLLSKTEASATYQKKGNYLTSHQSLADYAKKSDVPTNISKLTNDSKYITASAIPAKVSAFTNDANYVKKTELPTVPTNVSTFKNDAGYITSKDVPSVTVPENVSAFDNDAAYVKKTDFPTKVSTFSNDANYITKATYDAIILQCNNTLAQYKKSLDSMVTAIDQDKKELDSLKDVVKKVTVLKNQDPVDLGLPSGLKWASLNVGASSPQEYGDYYAWGEVATKSEYSTTNSITYGKTVAELKTDGVLDAEGNLTASHDAASQNLGDDWRIPTLADYQELMSNCTWTWTKLEGVSGYIVSSKQPGNTNSIFLPSNGYINETKSFRAGERGYYFVSTVNELTDTRISGLNFGSEGKTINKEFNRFTGLSIRPVQGKAGSAVKKYNVEISLSPTDGGSITGATSGSYLEGEKITITATPASGYKFKSWSDGNTEATRTLTVAEAVSLTATFEKEETLVDTKDIKHWFSMQVKGVIPEGLKLVDKEGHTIVGDGTARFESLKEYSIISFEGTQLDFNKLLLDGDFDISMLTNLEEYGVLGNSDGNIGNSDANYYATNLQKLKKIWAWFAKNEVDLSGSSNLEEVLIVGKYTNIPTLKTIKFPYYGNSIKKLTIGNYGGNDHMTMKATEYVYLENCPNLTTFNAAEGTGFVILTPMTQFFYAKNCAFETIWIHGSPSDQFVIRDMEKLKEITTYSTTLSHCKKISISNCPNADIDVNISFDENLKTADFSDFDIPEGILEYMATNSKEGTGTIEFSENTSKLDYFMTALDSLTHLGYKVKFPANNLSLLKNADDEVDLTESKFRVFYAEDGYVDYKIILPDPTEEGQTFTVFCDNDYNNINDNGYNMFNFTSSGSSLTNGFKFTVKKINGWFLYWEGEAF